MAFVAKKGPGPGAYDVKSNMGEGPSPSVRGRLGVFDKSSGVLNTMQSEFLRGIYKKEEQYYGKNDNAGNVLFQTAARNIVPHKANFDDLVKKFPERENPSTQEQLTSNLHSNVFGNANREPHSRYVSAAKRAMLEGMEGELKDASPVESEHRRHRDDFTDYVHATLRKRELDKTVDVFLKERQKR